MADQDRVEGRNSVAELLSSGRRVIRIMLLDTVAKGDALDDIRAAALRAGIPVERVSRSALDRESERGSHQGVIAFTEPFRYAQLADVLRVTGDRERALLIALDHVTDPGNLGAIVRTADVCGAVAVLVPKDRAAAMTPSALKAAAGAAEHVPVCREPNLVRSLEACKDAGWWIVGASEHAASTVWGSDLPDRTVLVLGAEGSGLARLTERSCDLLVSLPVAGHVSSLNVSAAAAVLAFDWVRRGADLQGE